MTLVLVTGGSGFIGQHLVEALRARGQRVRVLDVRPPAIANADVEYVHGSVLDGAAVDAALSGVDQVYHLAGLPGMWVADKRNFHDVNFRGTEVVLAAAMKRGVSRFLHCSTESILFPYVNLNGVAAEEALQPADAMPGAYTRSKSLAEHHAAKAAAAGFPLVIGTPTMPIGAADHNLTPPTAMLWYFLQKKVQPHLDFPVNLVDVRDVAMGLVLTMERGRVGQRYILGGDCVRLGQILRMMSAMSGRRQFPVVVPGKIAELSGIMLEYLSDTSRAVLPTAPPRACASRLPRATSRSARRAPSSAMRRARSSRCCAKPSPICSPAAASGASGAIEHRALSSRAS